MLGRMRNQHKSDLTWSLKKLLTFLETSPPFPLILFQVAVIYKDPSVGNLINIIIVKLVVIHDELVRLQCENLLSTITMLRLIGLLQYS